MLIYTQSLIYTDRVIVEQLWQQYKRLMYSTALKYTLDRNIQQDIVQNSVETIIKNISTIRSLNGCTLARYIVLIVRSNSINLLKQRNTAASHSVDYDGDKLEIIKGSTIPLDDGLVQKEDKEDIRRVLKLLPEDDRIILEGKYFVQLSDEELASLLCITKASVRMKLTRARRRAKAVFESEGYYNAQL